MQDTETDVNWVVLWEAQMDAKQVVGQVDMKDVRMAVAMVVLEWWLTMAGNGCEKMDVKKGTYSRGK